MLTLGSAGSLVVTADRAERVAAEPVAVARPDGCGRHLLARVRDGASRRSGAGGSRTRVRARSSRPCWPSAPRTMRALVATALGVLLRRPGRGRGARGRAAGRAASPGRCGVTLPRLVAADAKRIDRGRRRRPQATAARLARRRHDLARGGRRAALRAARWRSRRTIPTSSCSPARSASTCRWTARDSGGPSRSSCRRSLPSRSPRLRRGDPPRATRPAPTGEARRGRRPRPSRRPRRGRSGRRHPPPARRAWTGGRSRRPA